MSTPFNSSKAVDIYTAKTKLFPVEEEIFQKYLSQPGDILDLGCGTGRTSKPLQDIGHKVIGVDIAPNMIEQALQLYPEIDFRVGDASKLDFDDERFDYVLFSFNGLDCLYPKSLRLTALEEIYRVLKPGGCFIFSSHNRNSLYIPTVRRLRRIRHFEGQYFRERTVYGELILYYGSPADNLKQLEVIGFRNGEAYPQDNRSWRYYITWR